VSSPFIIGGRLLSQAFAPPQLGASATALFPSLLVGETTGGGFETLGGDKTHCFITRNK